MIRALLALAWLAAVALAGALPAWSAVARPARIAPAVSAALQGADQVRVIVELTDPPMQPAERANRSRLRARLATAQEDVVAGLPSGRATVVRRFEGLPAIVVETDAAGVAALAAHPRVKSITADRAVEAAQEQSVPQINADDTRDTWGLTGEGITVAVIDTGIDTDHPDLADDIAYEACFLLSGCPGGGTTDTGPGSAEDDHGHGSHVAGIITSTGVVAPKGVAPDAQIGAYKVLNAAGSGSLSDFDAALSDIIANHPEVDVVNMSLVDNTQWVGACDASFPVTASAINTLRSSGVATFISSGNNNFANGITFPSCIGNAIAVGAVYDATLGEIAFLGCTEAPIFDQVACWSNSASTVDILAPGAFITAPNFGGGIAVKVGTSMAAPHAAGVAAQLLEADASLSVSQIETALETTGPLRTDPQNGVTKPRIDALAALLSVADPDADAVPTFADNCPVTANTPQSNTDRNFIDHPLPITQDDQTVARSDTAGDACDTDDDNDGISDADEASGSTCAATVTIPLVADTDADRYLDGAECTLGTDPASAASKPTAAQCAAYLGVVISTDTDSDKLKDYIEFCNYNTDRTLTDADGDKALDGGTDGCEVASFNSDRIVNIADRGMLAQAVSVPAKRHVNLDVNKDGVWNIGDIGFVASFFGQCPG